MSPKNARWLIVLVLATMHSITVHAQPAPLAISSQAAPSGFAGEPYNFQLNAQGGIAPYSWRISDGKLPPGLEFEEHRGLISGMPTTPGEYRFTVALSDSAVPPIQLERIFVIKISAALTVEWKQAPMVRNDAIRGEVVVRNHTGSAFDLTVVVLAVNETGKAFALGYQQFTLNPETVSPTIPFGSSLPNGSYIVHVDAVAELATANIIHRARLQTPSPLEVRSR